jgi:hypothetical protein
VKAEDEPKKKDNLVDLRANKLKSMFDLNLVGRVVKTQDELAQNNSKTLYKQQQ